MGTSDCSKGIANYLLKRMRRSMTYRSRYRNNHGSMYCHIHIIYIYFEKMFTDIRTTFVSFNEFGSRKCVQCPCHLHVSRLRCRPKTSFTFAMHFTHPPTNLFFVRYIYINIHILCLFFKIKTTVYW